jgi:hypothetical protein
MKYTYIKGGNINMRKALEDLIFLGAVEGEVEILGKNWKLRTLQSKQHLSATNSTGEYDNLTRIYALKMEILGRALVKVDDIMMTDETETIEFIKSLQPAIVNRLYEEYETLQIKQNDSLANPEEIKN